MSVQSNNDLITFLEQQQTATDYPLSWCCWRNQYHSAIIVGTGEKYTFIASVMAYMEVPGTVGDSKSCSSLYAFGLITVSRVEIHCPSRKELQVANVSKFLRYTTHDSRFSLNSPTSPQKLPFHFSLVELHALLDVSLPQGNFIFSLAWCWSFSLKVTFPPTHLYFPIPCTVWAWSPSAGCMFTLKASDFLLWLYLRSFCWL